MANYIIKQCLTNDEYIISADTLTIDSTIEFGIGENLYCGTVEEVTEDPITSGYYYNFDEYSDCCECLYDDGRESLNFHFIRCDTDEDISIEATEFCSEYGVPTTGLTYEIQLGSDTPFCATFSGLSESGETNYHYSSGPFSNCEDCVSPPPISANTESTICQEVCDDSVITITPLHPTYINSAGQEVVQMNAVLLGGNGLNS